MDAHLQHRGGTLRSADRLRRREHAAPRRDQAALLAHARRRQDVDGDQHRHRRRRRRQHDSRGSAAAGTALRRHRHAGVGVVRRRRSLAVAAAQHAGDLGARPADQGRRDVPLRGSDRRHARPRLLDSRQRDAAASGRGGEGGAREERAVSLQAGAGGARALRRQRSDAVAARAAGRRERAAGRAHRLLPAARRAAARCSSRFSTRPARSCARYSSNEPVFDPDPGKDMAAYNEVCKKTPTAAYCGLPLYWPAPQFIISPKAGMHRFSWDLKFDPVSPDRSDSRRRRRSDRRGAGPHVSELQRAVGAARHLHRAAHRRRQDDDAADRRAPRSAREDRAAGADAAEHAQQRAVLGSGGRAPAPSTTRRRWPRRSTRRSGPEVDAIKGELEALAPTGSAAQRAAAPSPAPARPATPSLEAVSNALQAAAMAMQAAEVAPTAVQLAAANAARAQAKPVMARWAAVQAKVKAMKP